MTSTSSQTERSQNNDDPTQSTDSTIKAMLSPDKIKAVLFDMDGVVTRTAITHQQAWKETFDQFLKERDGNNFKEFSQNDYLEFVDGKAREQGIASFLKSRNISIPRGEKEDSPGFESEFAVGNLKNDKFNELLQTKGVETYETTVGLIHSLKANGTKIAIITASKNAHAVLMAANLSHIFDVEVDGNDAEEKNLKSKPAPDMFLYAAKQLGVDPKNAVVIEDAASGVEAGKNGGFGLVIGVARSSDYSLLKQHGATVVVRDLGEVAVAGPNKLEDANRVSAAHRGSMLIDLDISNENWVLSYDDFQPVSERHRESVCAVGNGYFCSRAAAPESRQSSVHYPGTYIAGIYSRVYHDINGENVEFEELVNIPNWFHVGFKIGDGEVFDLSTVEILKYEQQLQMREGVVRRFVLFRDKQGRETSLSQLWFVHMQHEHIAGIETTIKAENHSSTITIYSAIDGTVINSGTPKDPTMDKKHLEPLVCSADQNKLFLKMQTKQSKISIAIAARNLLLNGKNAEIRLEKHCLHEPGYVAHEMETKLDQGHTITLRKIVSVYTSRDPAISEAGAAAIELLDEAPDFDQLVEQQKNAWLRLWRNFDLFIETNEEHSRMQPSLLVHLHSFHVLQTASANIIDLDCGLPARGLTGEGYQGHIFWDDLFMFPFINLRTPDVTGSLLKYRFRRLNGARKIAESLGARGACFPWQSGSTGREDTPRYLWLDKNQQWAPDHTHLEVHVSGAVAYNIWQYFQVTENVDFMHSYGAPMFLEIARFFATFAKYNESTDRYEIHGVIGPDEYHNGYPGATAPGINNNAYTNILAAWTLTTALEGLKSLPNDYREHLCHQMAITDEEIASWDSVSRRMFVPIMKNGVIEQFDGYNNLQEFPWRNGDEVDMNAVAQELNNNGLVLNKYKISKQPDVLMLFYVFGGTELKELFSRLGYDFDDDTITRNIDYYMPRTINTSTLSRVALTWVLARIDRASSWNLVRQLAEPDKNTVEKSLPQHEPWNIFLTALGSDIFDIQGGSSPAEGVHMGAMAGTLDIIQRCYGGIVTRKGVLWLNPRLPEALTRLSFSLHYRGQALQLDITHEWLKIIAQHSIAEKIQIGFNEKVYALEPGDCKAFPLHRTTDREQPKLKQKPYGG